MGKIPLPGKPAPLTLREKLTPTWAGVALFAAIVFFVVVLCHGLSNGDGGLLVTFSVWLGAICGAAFILYAFGVNLDDAGWATWVMGIFLCTPIGMMIEALLGLSIYYSWGINGILVAVVVGGILSSIRNFSKIGYGVLRTAQLAAIALFVVWCVVFVIIPFVQFFFHSATTLGS